MHYLHSQQPAFIHGNLCAVCFFFIYYCGSGIHRLYDRENIYVDSHRRPVIVGYYNGWGRPRSEGSDLSFASSDIYTFSRTCLEVSRFNTGNLHCFLMMLITAKIFTGKWGQWSPVRPESPSVVLRGLNNDIWGLLCKCWSDRPESRPTINEICNFPPIAKRAIVRLLNRIEEGFVLHTPGNSASDKMSEFLSTIHSWLINIDLSSILDFPDLERIFAIILEKYSMHDLIKMIHDEYSPAGRAHLIDLLHEVAIFSNFPSSYPSHLVPQMLQFENDLEDRCRLDRLLRGIVKEAGQLPSSIVINDVKRQTSNPVAGGGFADIWMGMQESVKVAMKVLRIYEESEFDKQVLRVWFNIRKRHKSD